jgi:histidinol dehydrogenase
MPEAGFAVRALRDLSAEEARSKLARSASAIFSAEMRAYARGVLEDVERDGDGAVADYTRRWDGVTLEPAEMRVPRAEVEAAFSRIDATLLSAMDEAIEAARRYNEWLHPKPHASAELAPGIVAGVQHHAVRSVGLYVPSGKGTFPSTLITMGVPAVVAGVERISAIVPPRRDGGVDPAVLVAASRLGIADVFRCNGAAGVAALVVGTRVIRRADAVVGPGNPVITAIQQQAGAYGVRSVATLGPTESMILADDSADVARLAVDLLSEAEHGADTAVTLLSLSGDVAARVAAALPDYLDRLPEPRRGYARTAIAQQGGIFTVADQDEALAWINRYGPEHLQIATRAAREVAGRVRHAGEILIGQHTPFSAANYAIGVPAALPTSGAAFASSGVTVLSFLKTTSTAELSSAGLATVTPAAVRLGEHEGFPAHVLALTERQAGR